MKAAFLFALLAVGDAAVLDRLGTRTPLVIMGTWDDSIGLGFPGYQYAGTVEAWTAAFPSKLPAKKSAPIKSSKPGRFATGLEEASSYADGLEEASFYADGLELCNHYSTGLEMSSSYATGLE